MIRYAEHHSEEIIIEDSTPLQGKRDIMSNNKTKDRLTVYLSDKLIQKSKRKIVTATRESVQSNSPDIQPKTGISTQEEADTLVVLHALEITSTGASVDFFTQDTDWFVLLLRRFEQLGHMPNILTGTSESRRKVELCKIFDKLGADKSKALPAVHALTGTDTTGHINGIGKQRALKTLLESDKSVVASLSMLGAENFPSEDVIGGCMKFLCMLVGNKQTCASTDPGELRWKKFKLTNSTQGLDRLPPSAEHGTNIF